MDSLYGHRDTDNTPLCAFPATRQITPWFLSPSASSTTSISSTTGFPSITPSSDFVCAVGAFLGHGHSNGYLSQVPTRCSWKNNDCPSDI